MTVLPAWIFDWAGKEFLTLYVVAFCLALAWTVQRRLQVNKKFSHPDDLDVTLTDPYEIAFLAGGTARCSQVAVVRLLQSGSVSWFRAKISKESRLTASGQALSNFSDIERTLFTAILSYGKTGMPFTSVSQLVATRISGIESKLAKLGLRPTSFERSGQSFSIIFPMLFLALVGGIKIAIGHSREQPVVFLVLMVFATLTIGVIICGTTKRLTPKGEELLANLRDGSPGYGSEHSVTLSAVALTGVAGLAYDESLAGLDEALKNEISQLGKASAIGGSGDSGCSSGCGGGCGGCGD